MVPGHTTFTKLSVTEPRVPGGLRAEFQPDELEINYSFEDRLKSQYDFTLPLREPITRPAVSFGKIVRDFVPTKYRKQSAVSSPPIPFHVNLENTFRAIRIVLQRRQALSEPST
jgi:hypothetical protein